MVRRCVVCGEPQKRSSIYSFHKFPKAEGQRGAWAKACALDEGVTDLDAKLICSKHFSDSDYDSSVWPAKKLLSNAVPSPSFINQATSSTSQINENLQLEVRLPSADVLVPRTHEGQDLEKEHAVEEMVVSPLRPVRYVGDLTPKHFSTPRKAKRHLNLVQTEIESQRKRVKVLSVQKKRLQDRITSIKDLLEHLTEKKLISEEASNALMESTPSALQEILKRQLLAKNRKYDPAIRSFALTLHFYSVSAYNYLRRQFNCLLPHPETIRKWYMVIEGEPGFTKESLSALKLKNENGENIIINLVIDEMSIRQLIEWDGKRYHGYVDLGTELEGDGDERTEAKQALVFMAVSLNGSWRVPLGYFLILSLTGDEKANLVNTCLLLIHETGTKCNSITFDGASSNIAMANSLGCHSRYDKNFQPWFYNSSTKERVHVMWDACHMLKLIRNTLGDKHVLLNSENKSIEWKYIVRLHELEKSEGLRAGTKLTTRHINYQNEKMKVKLAAQVLSASVSSALLFCKEINVPEFENCKATAEFCLNINNAFDILNSRNLCAKYIFKRGMCSKNHDEIKKEAHRIIEYLLKLKDEAGNLIIETNRKTGFLGFIISLTSLLNLFADLVTAGHLKFLLSYKLSQDHLETFFGAIRQRGGHNNNPSAMNFKTAYKRLLVHHQVSASEKGNCTLLDAITILHVGAGTVCRTGDVIISGVEGDDDALPLQDHDYFSYFFSLSPYLEEVIKYIGGFVAKRVANLIDCPVCIHQLYSPHKSSLLLKFKEWGSLTMASEDVNNICIFIEKIFRTDTQKLKRRHLEEYFFSQLLKEHPSLFINETMNNHILSQDILDNHKIQLLKLITKIYLKVRLHHHARVLNDSMHVSRVRHKYTKLILFRNE